jgi:hypothetical protein
MTGNLPLLATEILEKLVHGLSDVLIALRCLSILPQPIGFLLLLSPTLGRDDIADDPFHTDLGDLLVQGGVF